MVTPFPLPTDKQKSGVHWHRAAWTAVILLWPVALLNYLDRQMLAAMKSSVMADITDIQNNANWGLMLGQFKWVYAFLSPVGGYIADRFSRRWTIFFSLLIWSAVTCATGHVESYSGLLWTRTLMGISEAFYIPAALALIADFHSRETRSRAVGVHQTAIYFGIILGGMSGYVADQPSLGWRLAFDAAGIVGMLYAFPLVYFLRDAQREDGPRTALKGRHRQSGHGQNLGAVFHELLFNRSYLLLVLCFTLPAWAGWIVKDWMPAILKDRFSTDQGLAGVAATFPVNAASLIAVFVGGALADRWVRVSSRGRIWVSAIGIALLVPALFGVGNSGSLLVAVLFLTLFGLGWGFFDCNNMPILSQIVRPELRATGYGFMNLVSISLGGVADWIFGRLKDQDVPLNYVLGGMACAAIVSVILMLCIRPRKDLLETQ